MCMATNTGLDSTKVTGAGCGRGLCPLSPRLRGSTQTHTQMKQTGNDVTGQVMNSMCIVRKLFRKVHTHTEKKNAEHVNTKGM